MHTEVKAKLAVEDPAVLPSLILFYATNEPEAKNMSCWVGFVQYEAHKKLDGVLSV